MVSKHRYVVRQQDLGSRSLWAQYHHDVYHHYCSSKDLNVTVSNTVAISFHSLLPPRIIIPMPSSPLQQRVSRENKEEFPRPSRTGCSAQRTYIISLTSLSWAEIAMISHDAPPSSHPLVFLCCYRYCGERTAQAGRHESDIVAGAKTQLWLGTARDMPGCWHVALAFGLVPSGFMRSRGKRRMSLRRSIVWIGLRWRTSLVQHKRTWENIFTTSCSSLLTSTFIIIHQFHRTFFGDMTNSTATLDTQLFFVYLPAFFATATNSSSKWHWRHSTIPQRHEFSYYEHHTDKKQNADQTRRSRSISIQFFLHELYLTGIFLI